MKHLFVPYELALLAKEKGFNEDCLRVYSERKTIHKIAFGGGCIKNEYYLKLGKKLKSHIEIKNICAAPLYQQLVDWFREQHDIIVGSDYRDYGSCGWIKLKSKNSSLYEHRWTNTDTDKTSMSYYNSFNFALIEAFKLI